VKKSLTIGIAAALAASSITPAVVAAAPNSPDHVFAKTKNKKEEEKSFVEKVKVQELTLEEAIRYGLNSNYSLIELEYTIENLKLQEDMYEDLLDVAESSYESTQRKIEELNKYLESTSKDTVTVDLAKEVTNLKRSLEELLDINPEDLEPDIDPSDSDNVIVKTQIRYLINFLENAMKYVDEYEKYQQRELVKEQLNVLKSNLSNLYFQVNQYKNMLDTLDIQRTQMFNNRVQMREQLKLPIILDFISLLLTEEQIDFMKYTLEVQQSQLNGMKTRYELGLVSRKDYEKTERDISDLETQIAELEKQLKHDKAVFATTIGITYDEDFKLIRPDLGELALIKQEKSTEELIKNSFDMVNARTNLRIKEKALDDFDDEENRTREREKMLENDVEVAKLQIEALQVELEKAIKNTFHQVQKQYEALNEAKKDLEQAKTDYADTQLYYNLGLLSKQEFDAANTSIKQAEFNYNNAKYQYYLLTKQVELMDKGVIVRN
jgi:Outer membrane efflux protein